MGFMDRVPSAVTLGTNLDDYLEIELRGTDIFRLRLNLGRIARPLRAKGLVEKVKPVESWKDGHYSISTIYGPEVTPVERWRETNDGG